MSSSFAEIVEEIKTLSVYEKLELQHLLEKYLIEERREEMYNNYVQSLTELEQGRLQFSSETGALRGMLSND